MGTQETAEEFYSANLDCCSPLPTFIAHFPSPNKNNKPKKHRTPNTGDILVTTSGSSEKQAKF